MFILLSILSLACLLFYLFFTPFRLELILSVFIIMFIVVPLLSMFENAFYKSYAAEAIGLLSDARNRAVVFYASHGSWPATSVNLAAKTEGKYTTGLQSQSGVFSMQFQEAALQEATLSLRTAASLDNPLFILSACGYHELPGEVVYQHQGNTTLPPAYLPFICRRL